MPELSPLPKHCMLATAAREGPLARAAQAILAHGRRHPHPEAPAVGRGRVLQPAARRLRGGHGARRRAPAVRAQHRPPSWSASSQRRAAARAPLGRRARPCAGERSHAGAEGGVPLLAQAWECGPPWEAMFPCGWEGAVLTPRQPFSPVFWLQPQVGVARRLDEQCSCTTSDNKPALLQQGALGSRPMPAQNCPSVG